MTILLNYLHSDRESQFIASSLLMDIASFSIIDTDDIIVTSLVIYDNLGICYEQLTPIVLWRQLSNKLLLTKTVY